MKASTIQQCDAHAYKKLMENADLLFAILELYAVFMYNCTKIIDYDIIIIYRYYRIFQ